MTHGGKRKGAGRKEGSIGRKSRMAISILEQRGCEPIAILADIAMGKLFPNGDAPTPDQVQKAASELTQYKYPKLKAVEHSGNITNHEQALEDLDSEDDDTEGTGDQD